MKKFIILIIFIFTVYSSYSTDIKCLWWNVKDFFDTKDDPDKDDKVLSNAEYSKKLNIISEKITDSHADIVGLAEVENIEVLQDIAKKTGYTYYYLEEGNDPRGIDIGFLSKYEVQYISHKNLITPYKGNKKYKFSRDCPEAIIKLDNKKLYILLNHLKSKVQESDDDKSDAKRTAQVNGILDIIADIYKKNKDEPYILIMGDFNSSRYSEPMNILQKSGLKILNYLKSDKDIYTMVYKNKKEDIDYIIFNKKLFEKSKIKIFNSFNTKDYKNASDHFPLFIEFEF
jgi:predicted extracellular nuclease